MMRGYVWHFMVDWKKVLVIIYILTVTNGSDEIGFEDGTMSFIKFFNLIILFASFLFYADSEDSSDRWWCYLRHMLYRNILT